MTMCAVSGNAFIPFCAWLWYDVRRIGPPLKRKGNMHNFLSLVFISPLYKAELGFNLNSHGSSIWRDSAQGCPKLYILLKNLRHCCLTLNCFWSTTIYSTLTLDNYGVLVGDIHRPAIKLFSCTRKLCIWWSFKADKETTVTLFHQAVNTDRFESISDMNKE